MREKISDEDENKNQRNRFIELEDNQWQEKLTIQWPKISEFIDENIGLKKIQEYIETVNQ